jgi:hypothetical protein
VGTLLAETGCVGPGGSVHITENPEPKEENEMKRLTTVTSILVLAVGIMALNIPHRALALTQASNQKAVQKAQPTAEAQVLKKEIYQGVPYLSGGVGIGEREHLREMHKSYNLKLIFALADGDYLADVNVVVENSSGSKVLDVQSPGPWFYTKLAPGQYTITATAEGKSVNEKVSVGKRGMTDIMLYWKQPMS